MWQQSVRPTEKNIERIVDKYSNMLFKIALVILCCNQDAEDAVRLGNSQYEKIHKLYCSINDDTKSAIWVYEKNSSGNLRSICIFARIIDYR